MFGYASQLKNVEREFTLYTLVGQGDGGRLTIIGYNTIVLIRQGTVL